MTIDPAIHHSLLSDKAILRHLDLGTVVIEPFNRQHLSTSSYDVTLGPHYFRETTPDAGVIGVYNPYDQQHVTRVWGEQLTAETHKEWSTRNGGQRLENIADEDHVIWIRPGETILAHTNEFIGGRSTVTTMMKARSSMGRNFIECCKCFPANVRLLTRRGYRFVEFIDMNDEVASYNPESQEIEFHRPSLVFKKSGTHTMVQVKQQYDEGQTMFEGSEATNHIEMATTDDHDWFVQFGNQEKNESEKETPFSKYPASSLTGEGQDDDACFRVLTSVSNGSSQSIRSESIKDLAWVNDLGIDTNDKCDAFLEFYGYWLGNGTLESSGEASCTSSEKTEKDWLLIVLTKAGFVEGRDFVVDTTTTHHDMTIRYQIKNQQWNRFFVEQYGSMYKRRGSDENQGESSHVLDDKSEKGLESFYWPDQDMQLEIESAKWFVEWVFLLNVRRLRLLIDALIMTGDQAKTGDFIFTSSVRLRDQLMRVLLFAGYAPHFRSARRSETASLNAKQDNDITSTTVGWNVFIGRTEMSEIKPTRDVTTFQLEGDVYCLTVPHHLVIAQTATIENGIVTSASQSIIIGQCAGWGDIGYTNRWTMEITSNSRHYAIPLVVGRRIAQIVFFDTDGTVALEDEKQTQANQSSNQASNQSTSYEITGKYQTSSDLAVIKANWKPSDMLPKMFNDRECKARSN